MHVHPMSGLCSFIDRMCFDRCREGSVIVEYTLLLVRGGMDDVQTAFLRHSDNGTAIGNFTLDRSFTTFQSTCLL